MFRFGRATAPPGPQPGPPGVSTPLVPHYGNGGLAVPGARPHRWPAVGSARPAATALLVVGAQRAIASQCAGASYVWETISALVAVMRPWGANIAWARHARSPANPSCPVLPPAHGPERGPAARRPGDLVALAYGVDGFSASPLADGLRALGTVHLVIAGFGLEGPSIQRCGRPVTGAGSACWWPTPVLRSNPTWPPGRWAWSRCPAASSGSRRRRRVCSARWLTVPLTRDERAV